MKSSPIAILSKLHGTHVCNLTYTSHSWIEVSITGLHFGLLTAKGKTLFDALVKLRLRLEEAGWLLLCNVARRDAYPSQMMLQMALGRKIYLLKHGKQARREDVVDSFGEALPEDVGTVQEQQEYHKKWIESLGVIQ